jgi:hypothetical protein
MAAKAKTAPKPTRFEEIIAARRPKEPTIRERLAAAVEARNETRAKIVAQAPQREKHERFLAQIAKKHKRGTSAYYRAVADAQRKAEA